MYCLIANNINRNVYMYLNTRIFPTTGYARVLLFMFIRRELGGTVQDVYFSLHTVYMRNILNTKVFTSYNSLHASGEFCRQPMAFCKQFESR